MGISFHSKDITSNQHQHHCKGHGITVKSRFFKPPRETKIGWKNQRVYEMEGEITLFDLGREMTFGSSYQEV